MTTQVVHEPSALALTVNGERRSVAPNTTLADFLSLAHTRLSKLGVRTTAAAVAAHYGAGLIGGWLVDERDKAAADRSAEQQSNCQDNGREHEERGVGDLNCLTTDLGDRHHFVDLELVDRINGHERSSP